MTNLRCRPVITSGKQRGSEINVFAALMIVGNGSTGVLRQRHPGGEYLHALDGQQSFQEPFQVGGPKRSPAFVIQAVGGVNQPARFFCQQILDLPVEKCLAVARTEGCGPELCLSHVRPRIDRTAARPECTDLTR